jgi:hypothetical protein
MADKVSKRKALAEKTFKLGISLFEHLERITDHSDLNILDKDTALAISTIACTAGQLIQSARQFGAEYRSFLNTQPSGDDLDF